MKEYPMAYDEYEKRVIELFLKVYPNDKKKVMISRLNNFLKEDPNFIKTLYVDDCFVFDNPQLYGANSKKTFEDYHLESVPVNTLHMLLGGNFD